MQEFEITKMKDLEDSEKLEFFKSFYYTHSLAEVAEQFNIKETSIYRWLAKYNIAKKVDTAAQKYPTKEELNEYYKAHTKEATLEYFNLTRAILDKLLKDYNIQKKEESLSIDKVVTEFYNCRSVVKCAEKFNCSSSSIYKILEQAKVNLTKEKINIDINEFKKFYIAEQHSRSEACEHFRITPAQLADFIEETGIKKEKTNYQELAKKLTKAEIEQYYIIEDHSAENTYNYFAAKYNVKPTAIQTLILKYKIDKLNYSKKIVTQYIEKHPNCTLCEIQNATNLCYSQICHLTANLNLRDQIKIKPQESQYEVELAQYLSSLNINYVQHVRNILGTNLELDLYIPDNNIAIEFNGAYWHSSIYKDKNYHLEKARAAQKANIRLIQIWDYEWDNLEQQQKIKALLRSALNIYTTRVFARNCLIKQISNEEAKVLNNQAHIQRHRNAQVTYGLFYQNKLIQLMSFSKTKYNKNLTTADSWEIIRGCTIADTIVIGGVSKLLKHFIADYQPDNIFSYCDFNKFNGDSYKQAGLQFIGYSGPDLHWLLKNGSVVNRNPKEHKKQAEEAQAKIYGAGSLKFILNIKDN